MSYRDDHQAAIARIDALDREHRCLAADNERLTCELTNAKEWLGGPRRRLALAAGFVTTVIAVSVAMFATGRATASSATTLLAPHNGSDDVTGRLTVISGRVEDYWTFETRCARYGNSVGVATGRYHTVWIEADIVELDLAQRRLRLDPTVCRDMFASRLQPTSDGAIVGTVSIDCYVNGDHIWGQIDFKNCR